MPSGSVGFLSVEEEGDHHDDLMLGLKKDATPEKPVTVIFRNPIADEDKIQWSSQDKSFVCSAATLREAGMIVIPSS